MRLALQERLPLNGIDRVEVSICFDVCLVRLEVERHHFLVVFLEIKNVYLGEDCKGETVFLLVFIANIALICLIIWLHVYYTIHVEKG